jgi:Protein of unknown function (DUF1566)
MIFFDAGEAMKLRTRTQQFVVTTVCALILMQGANAGCPPQSILTRPDSRYELVEDSLGAEVRDKITGLIWQRCSVGMVWTGTDCVGEPTGHTWIQALQSASKVTSSAVAGKSRWRLPSDGELLTLVERSCTQPAINLHWFPSTPPSWFWSSSPGARKSDDAWYADFGDGDGYSGYKDDIAFVRLVRSGS